MESPAPNVALRGTSYTMARVTSPPSHANLATRPVLPMRTLHSTEALINGKAKA